MYFIAPERPEDSASIEALLDRSFGLDRHKKTSYRFRETVSPLQNLRLTARLSESDRLVGTLRFWPILIGAKATDALLLGPIAIDAVWRKERIGSSLMWRGIDMASQAGHLLILLVGDYDYYKRFHFQPAAPLGLTMMHEKPERLLCLELAKGALNGVFGMINPWRAVRDQIKKAA